MHISSFKINQGNQTFVENIQKPSIFILKQYKSRQRIRKTQELSEHAKRHKKVLPYANAIV